ncbi:hypothetical protein PV326_003254, partial [Microctonus aethiopoides]
PRNYDPVLHPFEAAREYTRALNAVKLDRVFAKPFIGCLEGHKDGVSSVCKHPERLSIFLSGAFDDDKTIKTWKINESTNYDDNNEDDKDEPINTIISRNVITGITHHRNKPQFATCGEVCQLWEETRNEPIKTFKWGVDSLHDVKFNPVQTNLLAACASDRSIILYDTRDTGPLRKVVMKLRTNRMAWNPMEAYTFTCANEDYNLYTFDSRKLKTPVNVYMDHVGAVTDVDYSPTGKEFVSGSYDKSIRIYEVNKGHSREIYHTKRMQHLTNVAWSLDNKYILSGSDEMNIRMWKARASEKLGVVTLKEKFSSHPQIRRIARHRQIPKHIYNAQAEMRTIRNKMKRKEANRRVHSRRGTVPFVSERARHVVREEK